MKYSLIILNYNHVESSKRCIESILPLIRGKSAEMILVDDGSTDETQTYIKEVAAGEDQITAILLSQNQGTTHARNRGLAKATGDYALFLDNDTVWTGDVLTPLQTVLDRDPRIGIAGMCGVILPDLTKQIHIDYADFPEPLPVTAVTGYCLMVKRRVLETGIRFDPEMIVTQGEDIEFCLSAREKGFVTHAVPDVPLFHTGHGSLSSYEAKYQEIVMHNLTRMETKWTGKVTLPDCSDFTSLFSVLSDDQLQLRKTAQIGKYEFFDVLKQS